MFIDEKEPPCLDKVLAKMLVRIKHRDHCSSVEKALRYAWDMQVYARRIRWVLMVLSVGLYTGNVTH